MREQMVKSFWKRWCDKYIVWLRTANRRLNTKCKPESLSVGYVVIINDETTSKLFWSLDRVKECIPSRDGIIRKFVVLTVNGDSKRQQV